MRHVLDGRLLGLEPHVELAQQRRPRARARAMRRFAPLAAATRRRLLAGGRGGGGACRFCRRRRRAPRAAAGLPRRGRGYDCRRRGRGRGAQRGRVLPQEARQQGRELGGGSGAAARAWGGAGGGRGGARRHRTARGRRATPPGPHLRRAPCDLFVHPCWPSSRRLGSSRGFAARQTRGPVGAALASRGTARRYDRRGSCRGPRAAGGALRAPALRCAAFKPAARRTRVPLPALPSPPLTAAAHREPRSAVPQKVAAAAGGQGGGGAATAPPAANGCARVRSRRRQPGGGARAACGCPHHATAPCA